MEQKQYEHAGIQYEYKEIKREEYVNVNVWGKVLPICFGKRMHIVKQDNNKFCRKCGYVTHEKPGHGSVIRCKNCNAMFRFYGALHPEPVNETLHEIEVSLKNDENESVWKIIEQVEVKKNLYINETVNDIGVHRTDYYRLNIWGKSLEVRRTIYNGVIVDFSINHTHLNCVKCNASYNPVPDCYDTITCSFCNATFGFSGNMSPSPSGETVTEIRLAIENGDNQTVQEIP